VFKGRYFLQLSGCILECSESISCRKCSKIPKKCRMWDATASKRQNDNL
jgi:hypothetical protein